jgi:hypothetical protein
MSGIDLTDLNADNRYVFAEDSNEYMIRSKTRKLLLHREVSKSFFFDLESDPLEMENLFGRKEYQAEISLLRDRLLQWSLFDGRAKNHLNINAPRCPAENAPGEAELLRPYFREKMAEQSYL